MGFWGDGLYENDIALDIRDRIDPYDYVANIKEEVREIVAEIKEGMDIDEAPIAWLALADTLFDNGLLTPSIKKQAIRSAELIPDDMLPSRDVVQQIIEKINGEQKKRTRKRAKRVSFPQWKDGDIFLFDLIGEYANDPFYKDWNIGFWKTSDSYISPRNKCVNVYFFRTKHSMDDLSANPSLIRDAEIIPILYWKRREKPDPSSPWIVCYWMRVTLFIVKNYLPLERIHYCGHYEEFPDLWFEYPPKSINYDGLCPRMFPLQCIEERLLMSAEEMEEVRKLY